MKSSARGALIFLLLLLPLAGAAQTLAEQIDAILARSGVAGNTWTILVESEDGGTLYYQYNQHLPQTPASNTKLYTTAAAMGLLGTDYAFETRIFTEGTIDGAGNLAGNIHLVSEHDVTWNTSCLSNSRQALDHIANQLHALGLRSISGNVNGWGACFFGESSTSNIKGTAPNYKNAQVASEFRDALVARGITVGGTTAGNAGFNPPGTLYYTHLSSDMLFTASTTHRLPLNLAAASIAINRPSHNAMADGLLFHLGYRLAGNSNLNAGAAQVMQWMSDVAGLNTEGMFMNDGSGLSRDNKFTARQTVDLLRYMQGAFPEWSTTLTIGCRSGTLSSRLCTPSNLAGRVHGKTGTLGNTIAVSGYLDHPTYGDRIYFSFLTNRNPSIDSAASRGAIDDSIRAIATQFQPVAPVLASVRNAGDGENAEVAWRRQGAETNEFLVASSNDATLFSTIATVPAARTRYIIETRSGGKNVADYSEVGLFEDSASHSTAVGTTSSIGSRFAVPGDTNGRTDRAIFAPSALPAGLYDFYVTSYDASSANASAVTVRITDRGGEREQLHYIRWETTGNVWDRVGTIDFEPGQGHSIAFENATQINVGTSNNSRVNAAAVLLVDADPLDCFTAPIIGDPSARAFRVQARSPRGTSPPSDGYGMRVRDGRSPVLIVDGNDRWLTQSENPTRDNHNFAAIAGQAIALFSYDTADNDAVIDGLVNLAEYRAVVWLLGEESTADETFSRREQQLVTDYLSGGGKLFVSGAEIGWDLVARGSTADRDFYRQVLKHNYIADSAGTFSANGIAGQIFDGITGIDFSGGQMIIDFPDVLAPINGSVAVMNYLTGTVAGLYYDGSDYKVVGLGFPFESINNPGIRAQVMERVLGAFGVTVSGIGDTGERWIISGAPGAQAGGE